MLLINLRFLPTLPYGSLEHNNIFLLHLLPDPAPDIHSDVLFLPKEEVSFPLKMNVDDRGSFTELLKTANCGQFSVSDKLMILCVYPGSIWIASIFSPETSNSITSSVPILRLNWMKKLSDAQIVLPRLIHATAYVSPTAEVEAGTVVLPLAIINTDCRIQSGCIINCGSIVDHGCVIEEGVHISPGTVIKAENRIPRATKIEAGEVVPLRAYPL